MFDKEAQRQRAINQTAAFLKHGHTAPKNPVPQPKGPMDLNGVEFRKGQRVARAVKDGNSMTVRVCEVTHIAGLNVYLDHSMRSIGRPDRLLILK